MADESRTELEFRINTQSDNSGITSHTEAVNADTVAVQKQAAAVEEASQVIEQSQKISTVNGRVTGNVYASEVPDVLKATEAKKAYNIASEAEFIAVEKTLEASQRKLGLLSALGRDTTALSAEITALQAALSTEAAEAVLVSIDEQELASAMNAGAIAARESRVVQEAAMVSEAEMKAGQVAALEAEMVAREEAIAVEQLQASYTVADTVATEANTTAHMVNATTLREAMVISRELQSGNMSRLPGSASILMSRMGVGAAGLAMAGGGLIAALGLEAYFKWQEKIEKNFTEMISLAEKAEKSLRSIIDSGGSIDEHFVELNQHMAEFQTRSSGARHEVERMAAMSQLLSEHMQEVGEKQRQVDEDSNEALRDKIDLLHQIGAITDQQSDQFHIQADVQSKLKAMEEDRMKILRDRSAAVTDWEKLTDLKQKLPPKAEAEVQLQKAQFQETRDKNLILEGPKVLQEIQASIDRAKQSEHSKFATAASIERDGEFIRSQLQHKANIEELIEAAKKRENADEIALAKAKDQLAVVTELPDKIQAVNDKLAGLEQQLDALDKRQPGQRAEIIQDAATKATIDRLKGGDSAEGIFKSGITAQKTIQGFREKGLSDQQIETEGEAAKRKKDSGKQLSSRETKAISDEEALHNAQEQLKASQDLLTAMGWNAAQIQANFAQMVAMHESGAQIQKAVSDQLTAIHARLRQLQTQISSH